MDTPDLIDLIDQRSKLFEAYRKKKISKEDFEKELERLNDLIVSY